MMVVKLVNGLWANEADGVLCLDPQTRSSYQFFSSSLVGKDYIEVTAKVGNGSFLLGGRDVIAFGKELLVEGVFRKDGRAILETWLKEAESFLEGR